MGTVIDEAVAAQYRECPYPPRNPDDERHRLVQTHLADMLRVNGLLWGGRKRIDELRLLDAGCGTGDSAIYMASGAPEATVIALDQSASSLEIARQRAAVRGLGNLQFIHASLLDLPRLGIGPFDYIVCSGVLHHLHDPTAGAQALVDVLAPDGGLGLMLYGQFGREPIGQLQELMRRLCDGPTLADRVALAQQALQAVSPAHLFKVAKLDRTLLDVTSFGAAGIVDLLLHARDRAYTVDDLHALLDATGLRLLSFVRPVLYRPETYALSDQLRTRVASLPERGRQAIAELLSGHLPVHEFYATRAEFVPDVPGPDTEPSRIRPVVHEPALREHFRALALRAQPFKLESSEGFTILLEFTPMDCALLRAVDGRSTLRSVMHEAGKALRRANLSASPTDLERAWLRLATALEAPGYLGYAWADR